tara:strand:- start:95 stop:289 length:195 start_codon:yes stop_codon:yes gene_type:complete
MTSKVNIGAAGQKKIKKKTTPNAKGMRMGGKVKAKGMRMGGKVKKMRYGGKAKGMRMGGKVMKK